MKTPAMILFDVDGTIFDSQDVIVTAFNAAYLAQGYEPPSRSDILYTVGLSLDHAIAKMRPDFDGAAIEAVAHSYVQQFIGKTQHHRLPFYPGMRRLIGALSHYDHLWLGVATGKNRRGLDPLLEANGLYQILTIKQTPDFHPSKPAPDMLIEASERYGVEPAQMVMIGDTHYDIEMGKNAGVRTIGVTWGYHGRDVGAAQPDALVDHAAGIFEVLQDWELL